ncbi:MAG TPA: hypothetical protein ENK06_07435 [Gammaproteobacteria bacterium]|nr:hypothetical protein [Gammaproteobacteria bacterium]
MMSNEELMEVLKAFVSTTTGGVASAQDAEEFIDLAVDQTAVLGAIRVETDIKSSMNVDSLEISEPSMMSDTEGEAPADADIIAPSIPRKTLTPKPVRADYDVSFKWLRKNIAGERANEQLNQLFAKRWGKDSVQLIFNGDTSLSATSRTNKLLMVLDGFLKTAAADANVHAYDIPTTPNYSGKGGVFNEMLQLLPKDYRDDRESLAFFVSQNVLDDYLDELGERQTALGDTTLLRGEKTPYKGVVIWGVYKMPDDEIILTPSSNLVVGYGGDMEVGRFSNVRKGRLEVTIRGDIDAKYISSDALVYGKAAA